MHASTVAIDLAKDVFELAFADAQGRVGVQDKRGHNKAACALANKLARRLWAMEQHGQAFDPRHVSQRPVT